jgi:hypothetical protein
MTRDEALIGLYSVFHVSQSSADVNLVYIHKILDDLIATEREAILELTDSLGWVNSDDIRARRNV